MLLSVQVRGLSEGGVAIRTEVRGNVVLPTPKPEVRVYDRRLGARIGVALGGATTEKRRTVLCDGTRTGVPGNSDVKTVGFTRGRQAEAAEFGVFLVPGRGSSGGCNGVCMI
jgi:hypothetical protein